MGNVDDRVNIRKQKKTTNSRQRVEAMPNKKKCAGRPTRHPRGCPAAQGLSLSSTVTGQTLGHLNGSTTGMNTVMIDFKMNLSAVGIDGLNQLGFDSDARRQCIDGLSIGKIG